MPRLQLLVLGTSNRKKGQELAAQLAPLALELRTLADFAQALRVAEEGDSFADHARAKAAVQARHLHEWVLGEDSGLVVDALEGAPGIRSARFAGPAADDAANNRRLLEELASRKLQIVAGLRGHEDLWAHYVCHMAVADPSGTIRAESCAICRGRIAEECRGHEGFGYDPLFEIPEYHRTLAELGEPVKRWLSHRARAARRLIPQLRGLM